MIKINIDTNHVADLSDDKELNRATCEISMYGNLDEIRAELNTMLQAFEKRQPLYTIWLDVLGEWAAKRCDEK